MMNKFLHTLLFLLLASYAANAQSVWDGSVATDYAGGNGSSEYPYLIANGQQLAKLAQDVNNGTQWSAGKYFALIDDIVLNDTLLGDSSALRAGTFNVWAPIGSMTSDLDYNAFMGYFDGGGHTIAGIYIYELSVNFSALFCCTENATIKNLGVVDSYINGNAYVGTIVGAALNSRIVNCYSTGRVDGRGSYHGGIVGMNTKNSVVANCYNLGVVAGKNNVGGIVARNGVGTDSASVLNCFSTGRLETIKTNKAAIVAENNTAGLVRDCFFLQTDSAVYTNTGFVENLSAKTNGALHGTAFATQLNGNSMNIPLACRWDTTAALPVHNYTTFTDDNKQDISKIANGPQPANGDTHAAMDGNTVLLQWKPASNGKTQRQFLYLGDDRDAILALSETDTAQCTAIFAGADTLYRAENRYSMDTYYWRVDQLDSAGLLTKGELWSFRPQQLAFPEAQGYGRYAIGGRGGKVVYVTNLDDNGPGSFRDAVENATGPRTIVFAVSGMITLNSRIKIEDDNITVSGQTAPGKGICFRWAPIGVVGNDLIVQNLRVRIGYGVTYDGMGLTGSHHSIIDHCSISWTIDEAFSSRYAKNISLQRTLISEALNQADHGNYGSGTNHGYAASIGGDIGSFHHNLLAHCEGRNWSLAGGLDAGANYAGRLDIFNNVCYNWGGRATDGGAHEVNFVGNYYKKGAATTQNTLLRAQLEGAGKGTQSYFYADNILEGTSGSLDCDGADSSCSRNYELSGGQVLDWEVWSPEPFFPSLATIHSAKEAYKRVLSDVGCTQPALDEHDQRVVTETIEGTYSFRGSKTNKPGMPDHEKDAGRWEAYPGYVRDANWDTDLDGLPNWWEKAKGLDTLSVTGDFTESNADTDRNGYTNLEEYLHWMDRPHYFMADEQHIDIDLTTHARGFTNNPAFGIASTTNGTAQLNGNSSVVSFTPLSVGLSQLEYTVSDADGTTMTQRIGIYNGYTPTDSLFTYTYNLERTGNATVTVDTVNTIEGLEEVLVENKAPAFGAMRVYPNPANQIIYVDFDAKDDTQFTVLVLDVMGKPIQQGQYAATVGPNTLAIKLDGLNPGMYMLQVQTNTSSQTLGFIRE